MKRELWSIVAALLITLSGCGRNTAVTNALPQEHSAEPAAQAVQEESTAPSEAETVSPPERQADQAFTKLELSIAKGELYIRSGDTFSLTRRGGQSADYEIRDDTLYLENRDAGDTVLTLPDGSSYETLSLTVGDGHVYVETPLALQTLVLDEKHGEAKLESVSVSESSTVNVNQGSAFLSGDLGPSVSASCQEGHLSLELTFAQGDSNYEIGLSEGNIRLGGESYQGKSTSRTIDNGADRSMELNCRRGDISVEFKK